MAADVLKPEHAWDAITHLMQLLRSDQDMRHSSRVWQVLTCQPVTVIVCICCYPLAVWPSDKQQKCYAHEDGFIIWHRVLTYDVQ